jgi:3-oxoacyl-[acyl-carrier protein] reductase
MEIDGQTVQLGIPDQMRSMAPMLIPIGRPGTPEEAAGGVFFLCSPWSNFVTARCSTSPAASSRG